MSPYEQEFSCSLVNSKKFIRFARQERKSKEFGKKYSAVIGWKADESSQDVSYRYHKDIWSEEEVKAHCKSKKGTFEPLKEVEAVEYVFVSPGELELRQNHLISIEILKEGNWKHPKAPNGVLVLTKSKLQEFIGNFKDKIVGSELPIDLEHEIDPKGAVGWLRKMWLQAKDGISHLWAELDIVNENIQKRVKSGELKYFSPSLNFGYENPEDGNLYDVVRAGALTNYPYLKNMSPAIINFSEISPGKITPERENGQRIQLLENQVKLLKGLWLREEKDAKDLKKDNQRLALELRMSELMGEGRIVPSEKHQIRALAKEDFNSALVGLKFYEARKPVIEFGQKSEIMSERQAGSSVSELVKLCESKDERVRESALRELTERFERRKK